MGDVGDEEPPVPDVGEGDDDDDSEDDGPPPLESK